MSQQLIKTLPSLMVLAVICLTTCAAMATVEAPVLQQKLGRLYFGAGTESAIYPGCTFQIVCDTDTVTHGTIEQSLPGVSFSKAKHGTAVLPTDTCRAHIQPAAIDSNAAIAIAAPHVLPALIHTGLWPASELNTNDTNTRHIDIIDSIPFIDLSTSVQFEMIDAFLDHRDHSSTMSSLKVASSPAPYVAVLLPNLDRAVNHQTLLTTSLYYRFSAERLSLVFPGDRVLPLNCLFPGESDCPRPYPYDPQRGRQLLQQIDPPVRDLRLAVADHSLERTGLLFVDVLARDHVSAALLTGNQYTEADCAIVWIYAPLDDALVPLQRIHAHLQAMNSNHPAHLEALDMIGRYLAAAVDAPDEAGRRAYARLAAQRLSADLGVFALFRPRLYFHSQPQVVNFTFDTTGRPILSNLQQLILPNATNQTERRTP